MRRVASPHKSRRGHTTGKKQDEKGGIRVVAATPLGKQDEKCVIRDVAATPLEKNKMRSLA